MPRAKNAGDAQDPPPTLGSRSPPWVSAHGLPLPHGVLRWRSRAARRCAERRRGEQRLPHEPMLRTWKSAELREPSARGDGARK